MIFPSKTALVLMGLLSAGQVIAQPSPQGSDAPLPEDFFGTSESMKDLTGRNEDPGFPIFPRAGNPDADVTIEYFYSHDCAPCVDASRALFTLLRRGEDIDVTFHPVGLTEESYFDAVVETVLYGIDPKMFELFHFGSMAAVDTEQELDSRVFMRDIADREGHIEVLEARLDRYEEWTSSLAVNSEILKSLEARDLPVFIVNDALYQGFAGIEDLVSAIRSAKGEEILKSRGQ